MDLRKFINEHKDTELLKTLMPGFARSDFTPTENLIHPLVKDILSTILESTESKKIANQLQSGGIAKTVPKQQVSKKQSYCTEFTQMVNCVLGLLGFELSRNLFLLHGMKFIIRDTIEAIKTLDSYADILHAVVNISRMLQLGDGVFDLDVENTTSDAISYNSSVNRFGIVDKCVKTIRDYLASNNISNLPAVRSSAYRTLRQMYEHLIVNEYVVNSIDQLVVNCGSQASLCYNGSFLKLFEMTYKETFTDEPYELWYRDVQRSETTLPFYKFILDVVGLESFSYAKYFGNIRKYYSQIAERVHTSITELTVNPNYSRWSSTDVLSVSLTEDFYENIVNVTLNLFVTFAKNLALSQQSVCLFGKNTRIQLMQVYAAIISCLPRGELLNDAQQEVLHFILLAEKIFSDSVDSVLSTQPSETKTVRRSRKK